jgi:hypothetical protein
VVGEQARSMVNLICGEGQRGAHRSGRPVVAQCGRRGNLSAAWMEGHRWWTSGQGVPVDHGEAFKSSCMAEGGRRVHDDGELHEEEDTAVELGSPASVAGASSCSVDARHQNGRGKTLLPMRKVITSLRLCGRRPPVVYGHRCVTVHDVMRTRAGDRSGQLSSV